MGGGELLLWLGYSPSYSESIPFQMKWVQVNSEKNVSELSDASQNGETVLGVAYLATVQVHSSPVDFDGAD